MTKFFNSEDMMKSFDVESWTKSSQQSMDTMQQATSMMAETMTTCMQKCVSMSQNAMQDSISAAKELSTAKDWEDYMNKQSMLTQKASENAQKNAQELATLVQESQSKCMSMLAESAQSTMQSCCSTAKKTATKSATK